MTDARTAFLAAREEWKRDQFAPLREELVKNFTGRMFNRGTGTMLGEVLQNTKLIEKGIEIGTSSPALIAWMLGSPRAGFFVRPKNPAGALSWIDKRSGQRRYSKGHFIPPWVFRPRRPALDDALERRKEPMVRAMREKALFALSLVFPNERIVIQVRV
jgi:hypothetical protein